MVLGGLWGVIVGLTVLAIGHVGVTAPVTGYTAQLSVRPFGWAELTLGMFVLAVGICGFACLAWSRIAPRRRRRSQAVSTLAPAPDPGPSS